MGCVISRAPRLIRTEQAIDDEAVGTCFQVRKQSDGFFRSDLRQRLQYLGIDRIVRTDFRKHRLDELVRKLGIPIFQSLGGKHPKHQRRQSTLKSYRQCCVSGRFLRSPSARGLEFLISGRKLPFQS